MTEPIEATEEEIEPVDDVDDAIDLLEQALDAELAVARELIGEALDYLRSASDALSEDFLLTVIKCDDDLEPDETHIELLDTFEPDEEDPDASLAALNTKLRMCNRPATARFVEDEEDVDDMRDEQ